MLALSFFDISQSVATDELVGALPFGPNEKNRLLSIKNKSAQARSLSALLALQALIGKAGVEDGIDLSIIRQACGKPVFSSLPLYFSLSHTDNLAVAALSDKPIGVDLEFIDSARNIQRISSGFFNDAEREYMSTAPDIAKAFFELWTKKEAAAKLSGKGLGAVSEISIFDNSLHFLSFDITHSGSYAILSLCSEEPDEEEPFIFPPDGVNIFKIV